MNDRNKNGRRLSGAPIVYALFQIRFGGSKQIDEAVRAALYEKLREFLPRDESGYVLNIVLPENIERGKNIAPNSVSTSMRIELLNEKRTFGIVIANNLFAFHATEYEDSNDFDEHAFRALPAVLDVLDPVFIERIGLRYINFIPLSEGRKPEEFLQPGLTGFPVERLRECDAVAALGDRYTRSECRTRKGILIVQSLITERDMWVAPDLEPIKLQPPEVARSYPKSGVRALLDIDHYTEMRKAPLSCKQKGSDFWKDLREFVGELHLPLSQAFRSAVTESALKEWE